MSCEIFLTTYTVTYCICLISLNPGVWITVEGMVASKNTGLYYLCSMAAIIYSPYTNIRMPINSIEFDASSFKFSVFDLKQIIIYLTYISSNYDNNCVERDGFV